MNESLQTIKTFHWHYAAIIQKFIAVSRVDLIIPQVLNEKKIVRDFIRRVIYAQKNEGTKIQKTEYIRER